jgi:inorganic triphosphatase YgiF
VAEVELKFDIAPRDVRRLRRAPPLARAKSAATQRFHALYFDTPDEMLAARALTLRLRREGTRWVQTLKGGGRVAGGLHARDEWEFPTEEGTLDLARFRDTPLAALPEASTLHERLHVAFEVDVERTAWTVRPARGTVLEVALDVGEVRHGERRDPVCEVEVESKAGPESAVFDLALRLLDHVRLVPSAVSKAQRGYRLARGETLAPVHARCVVLDDGTSAARGAAAIMAAALEQVLANAEGVAASDHPEFVHQLRVALRRVRSALRVFRRAWGESRAREAQVPLRWITSVAGRARDLDVFASRTLPAVVQHAKWPADDVGLAERLHEARVRARRRLTAALRSPRYTRAVLALARLVHEAGSRGPALRPFAAKRLKKARAALLHEARALEAMDASSRHRLRIRAKRMRYALDACGSLYPARRMKPWAEALSDVQDALGEANDARMGRELLRELRAPGALARSASAWLDEQETRRTREAVPAFGRLAASRPPWRKH